VQASRYKSKMKDGTFLWNKDAVPVTLSQDSMANEKAYKSVSL